MSDQDKINLPKQWIGCPIEAEYFGEERKSGKIQRKLASAKDRSKYKKTDKRKEANRQDRELKIDKTQFEQGRVISIASQGILVDVNGKLISCTLRGLLKKDKTQFKNLITVGDFVLLEISSSGEGIISHVEPRRTILSRAENLSRRKEQLIASNIDQVLITVSAISPPLKFSLIDRYIIATQKGGMKPIIVVNKVDLLTDPQVDPVVKEVENDLYQEMLLAYKGAGVPMIGVSIMTGEGLDLLKAAMKDKSSVFSGQSGVGKSSLINALTGHSLKIGTIVNKTNKGTHTTTMAQLLRLDFGGWCIDTPGIKSFGVWDLDKEEVEQYFPEIFNCGHQCHFPDCSHMHEEGCKVVIAVEKGEISPLRYESYLSLMQSVEESHFRR